MKHSNEMSGHSHELEEMLQQPMNFWERWGILLILVLSLFLLFVGMDLYAQPATSTTLHGFVKTEANTPAPGVNVIVTQLKQKYKILGAGISSKDGSFSVSFHSQADSVSLYCSGMTINATHENLANKDAFVTVFVEEKAQKLKEVTVKAQKIYVGGDTVNYNVASFLNKNDQSLAEVLKRMPGITVANSGQISYKGLPIKNFYIEGLDLMKGRYGIATNNVDPNSVSTVQVLENHQDIKALKNLRPEEHASINLKLKEGVKGVFNLIGTIGGGVEDKGLWTGELLATYFRKNSQLLATYKGNNVGDDLETELRSFDGDDYTRTSNLTGVEMPTAPGIDKRYYYFNRSHSATFNNIYRIGKNGSLGINIGALSDRDSRDNQSAVYNLLPDGAYHTMTERISANQQKEMAYGNLAFIENQDKRYVKDLLMLDYSSLKGVNSIVNEGDIMQQGRVKDYRLHNELHLTSKFRKDRGIDFISKLNVEKRPQNLSVDSNLFPDLLYSNEMNQWVERRNFETRNQLGLLSSWVIGNLQISPIAYCDVHHDKLQSTLEQYKNHIVLTELNTGVGVDAVCKFSKIVLDINVPVGYIYQYLNDQLENDTKTFHGLNFEPKAKVMFQFDASHSLTYSGSLSKELPAIENLYAQYILNNYRQLSCYATPSLYTGTWLSNRLSYNYKNIFKMFFVDVELGWSRNKPKMLYGSTYDGVVEKVESQATGSVAERVNVKLNASKGFDWKNMKLALQLNYARTDSPILLQGEELNYTNDTWSIKMDVSATIAKWMTASHESSFYSVGSKISGGSAMASLRSMTNDTSVDFLLPAGVSLSANCSHYYNSLNEKDKSFVLCGLSAKYSHKRWLFTLRCNNLFDKKLYSHSTSSELTESISDYRIRRRSVLLTVRYRIL